MQAGGVCKGNSGTAEVSGHRAERRARASLSGRRGEGGGPMQIEEHRGNSGLTSAICTPSPARCLIAKPPRRSINPGRPQQDDQS